MDTRVSISEKQMKDIRNVILSNKYYADMPFEKIIESLINIGLYAYTNDGTGDCSIHLREDGGFGMLG
jgi:hypothetical protein